MAIGQGRQKSRSLRHSHVIPIHHDIPLWEADPEDLRGRMNGELVIPIGWAELTEGR
ncbi:MAG: hypothetical protein ISS50_01640 [Anaerolineae bacterium]|nr:hypothetical protein [Anaerolineae bacterium]